jgi:purine-nucleoside phosphorylase
MTPHNEAQLGQIAKTVIMPGDPLRAKMIAERYLENVQLVNSVRNVFAYTGTYKGKEITVMASGMGMPSIGIYSYELYNVYGVENIIRVGSAGSYTPDLKIYDVLLATSSYSESSYAKTQNGEERNILESSKELNDIIINTAIENNIKLTTGRLHSSDVFYRENNNWEATRDINGCLAVEMESFALFHNANVLGKKATCLVTISDSFVTKEETTSEERQNSFNNMIELALEASLKM